MLALAWNPLILALIICPLVSILIFTGKHFTGNTLRSVAHPMLSNRPQVEVWTQKLKQIGRIKLWENTGMGVYVGCVMWKRKGIKLSPGYYSTHSHPCLSTLGTRMKIIPPSKQDLTSLLTACLNGSTGGAIIVIWKDRSSAILGVAKVVVNVVNGIVMH